MVITSGGGSGSQQPAEQVCEFASRQGRAVLGGAPGGEGGDAAGAEQRGKVRVLYTFSCLFTFSYSRPSSGRTRRGWTTSSAATTSAQRCSASTSCATRSSAPTTKSGLAETRWAQFTTSHIRPVLMVNQVG